MRDWEYHLTALLEGRLDAELEFTIKEVVGNAPVTLDDLKYACAIVGAGRAAFVRLHSKERGTARSCFLVRVLDAVRTDFAHLSYPSCGSVNNVRLSPPPLARSCAVLHPLCVIPPA